MQQQRDLSSLLSFKIFETPDPGLAERTKHTLRAERTIAAGTRNASSGHPQIFWFAAAAAIAVFVGVGIVVQSYQSNQPGTDKTVVSGPPTPAATQAETEYIEHIDPFTSVVRDGGVDNLTPEELAEIHRAAMASGVDTNREPQRFVPVSNRP